jgi:hypothetical protein
MALPPRNKGTGFTNINRVLDANKGNRLGQTVVSGVQNQVNNVQSNLQNATNKFQTEAQKNLVDTEENKQARGNVIGRFGENQPNNFAPDMSNFKASSGLQEQYNAAKSKYEQEKLGYQNDLNKFRTEADNKLKYFTSNYGEADPNRNLLLSRGDKVAAGVHAAGRGPSPDEIAKAKLAYEQYQNALASQKQTEQLLNKYDLEGRIKAAEEEMNRGVESERQRFIEDQRRIFEAQRGPTAEELSQFEKFRSGNYAGPKELEDFGSLYGNAKNIEMLGDLTRSTGGQQELLRRFVGGTNYNKGQQKLDTALLAQNPAVNQVRKSTQDLSGIVNKSNTAASSLAQEFANRNKNFAQETVEGLQSVINPLSSQIDQKLTSVQAEEAKRAEDYNALRKALEKNGVKAAADAGLLNQMQKESLARANQKFGNALQDRSYETSIGGVGRVGLDPKTLLANNLRLNEAKNVSRAGVADITQESRMNALQRLLGQSAEFANPSEDYVASKNELDFNNINKEIYNTGLEKLSDYQNRANQGYKDADNNKARYARFQDDSKQLLDAFKQMSKFYGYDPDNQ